MGQSLFFTVAAVAFWDMFPVGFLQAPATLTNRCYGGFKCKKSFNAAERGKERDEGLGIKRKVLQEIHTKWKQTGQNRGRG